ncbi:MAG: tyrosine-type recombinase/integrase [Chitinophagaceae bacterium]
MYLPEAVRSFADYLKYQKRYSAHTLRSYTDDLLQFCKYLEQEFDLANVQLSELTPSIIRSWLASMKDGDALGSRSINRKISSLKSFFKYHIRMGSLAQTPMTQVSSPKVPKRMPVFVKEEETSNLLKHVEFTDDWQGRTDRLLIELLYNTGLRSAEVIALRESQVDESRKIIKVLGKGNKERIIPLSPELIKTIRSYITEKKEREAEQADQLLVTEGGKALYAGYVYRAVKKYLKLVTTVQKKSPHVLRHTFATHLLNNGADLNSVKELLGHSSLAATQVYTHHTIEKLKDVHKKAHPKA